MNDEEKSLQERLRAAIIACRQSVFPAYASPAEVFDGLAEACRELGIEEWDVYAERGPVARLEAEVSELLGKPAAYFPSGTMAQQVALRIHADTAGSRRVAMPDLSHLLVHEDDGPRILQDLLIEHLTTGRETPTRAHLDAIPGPLAACLVELPLRDAGCVLPTFDELAELAQGCREREIAFHLDGARIWESQQWFGKPLADVAGLADTVYTSFYKGVGGLAGAALLGDDDFVAQARLWRHRMGGTLYRSTAEAVSALVGLRDRLPQIGECVTWGRTLAAALPASISVQPRVPHTNTFLLYAAGDPDEVNTRLLAALEEHSLAFSRPWTAADEPGRVVTEVTIGQGALELDPETVAAHLTALLG
ncbi:beta-eliminating lyase-related protein [Nocardioides sp. NPDC047086]|uniref:threonine aldolase family protein n=1 Tax=Nocardioides sp. NPDC047086 TaxID=3154810 RepID=UPI00340264AF